MNTASRRTFLRALGAVTAAGLTSGFAKLPSPRGNEIPVTTLGLSQGGQPLLIYHYNYHAAGPSRRILIMGGQHGGPERNTVDLARQLMDYYIEHLNEIPEGIELDFMPEANPDGLSTGERQYLSGVDPNRNWDGPGWQSDGWDSNGRFVPGLGGPEPFSEPETRALADWLYAVHPTYVINYHSVGGFMFAGGDGIGGELGRAYAEASGYRIPGANGSGGSPLGYRVTGSMNVWLRGVGIAGTLIELASVRSPEFERNLAGLQALLARLAQA